MDLIIGVIKLNNCNVLDAELLFLIYLNGMLQMKNVIIK